MRSEIAEAIKPREEEILFAGHKLIVRELPSAADLSVEEDAGYRLLVACTFEADGVTPAMTAEDIPALRAGSRKKLAPLVEAVHRVNGFDGAGDVKKSDAGLASASSTA
jgi:hypothetical protein